MQTYGLQASRSPVFAMREMLKRAEPIKVLSNFGSQYEVPKNSTDTIAMRRAQPIDFVTNTAAPNYGAPVVDPAADPGVTAHHRPRHRVHQQPACRDRRGL